MAVVRQDGVEELAAHARVVGPIDKSTLEAAEKAREAQDRERREQLERLERETKED